MGHNWRDMDPVGAEREDKRIDRKLRLREELGDLKLSEFTVKELGALLRLHGLAPLLDQEEPDEDDLRLLEKKLEERVDPLKYPTTS